MHTSSRSIGESGYLPAPWLGLSVGRRAASFTVSYASQFFDLSRFQSSYTLAYAALSWPLSLNRTASVTPNAFISFFSPFCRDTPVGTRCSCASPQSSWILFTPGIRVTGTTLFVRSANQTRIAARWTSLAFIDGFDTLLDAPRLCVRFYQRLEMGNVCGMRIQTRDDSTKWKTAEVRKIWKGALWKQIVSERISSEGIWYSSLDYWYMRRWTCSIWNGCNLWERRRFWSRGNYFEFVGYCKLVTWSEIL